MTTLAVGNRRLLRLAAILEKVPNKKEKDGRPKFYMHAYVHACGTPACAAGWWAAANPKRWALGSIPHLRGSPYWAPISTSLVEEFALDPVGSKILPFDKGPYAHVAVREADILFGGPGMGGAKTGKQAAAFIRKFVAWRTDEAAKRK